MSHSLYDILEELYLCFGGGSIFEAGIAFSRAFVWDSDVSDRILCGAGVGSCEEYWGGGIMDRSCCESEDGLAIVTAVSE